MHSLTENNIHKIPRKQTSAYIQTRMRVGGAIFLSNWFYTDKCSQRIVHRERAGDPILRANIKQLQNFLAVRRQMLAHITKLWNGTNDPETQITLAFFLHFFSWSYFLSFLLWGTELRHQLPWVYIVMAHDPKVKNQPTKHQFYLHRSSVYSKIIKWEPCEKHYIMEGFSQTLQASSWDAILSPRPTSEPFMLKKLNPKKLRLSIF